MTTSKADKCRRIVLCLEALANATGEPWSDATRKSMQITVEATVDVWEILQEKTHD